MLERGAGLGPPNHSLYIPRTCSGAYGKGGTVAGEIAPAGPTR